MTKPTTTGRRAFLAQLSVAGIGITVAGCGGGSALAPIVSGTKSAGSGQDTSSGVFYATSVTGSRGTLSVLARAGSSSREMTATYASAKSSSARAASDASGPVLTVSLSNDGSSFTVQPFGLDALTFDPLSIDPMAPLAAFGGTIVPRSTLAGDFAVGANTGSYQISDDGDSVTVLLNGVAATASLPSTATSSSRRMTQSTAGAIAAGVGVAAGVVAIVVAAPEIVLAAGVVAVATGVLSIFDSLPR